MAEPGRSSPMRKTVALVACGGVLVAGGVFAGTVIGDDGSSQVVDRVQGSGLDAATADVEVARSLAPDASAAGGGKKVTILKGEGKPRSVPSGSSDGVIFRCPSGYSALA